MKTKEKHTDWTKIQKELKDEKILAEAILSIKLDRDKLIKFFNSEKNEKQKNTQSY